MTKDILVSVLLFIMIFTIGCSNKVSSAERTVPVNEENTSLLGKDIIVNTDLSSKNSVIIFSGSFSLQDKISGWIKKNPDKMVVSISYMNTGDGSWILATVVYKDIK